MPFPNMFGSPRSDSSPESTPATLWPSRFSANIRTLINGSSVYSQSPALPQTSNPPIPKSPFPHGPQSPLTFGNENGAPRYSRESASPLHLQPTAGSYIRAIAPQSQALPQPPEMAYNRHPADVPLDYGGSDGNADLHPDLPQRVTENIDHHRRRHRRHRKRRHHSRKKEHWVRKHQRKTCCVPAFITGLEARRKALACIISGIFLITVLAVYLTIALTDKTIGQAIHVLFIMIVLATTIFFCHSLIRMCMLLLHPPVHTPPIPSLPSASDGFRPAQPIRVHVARDDDLGAEEADLEHDYEVDVDDDVGAGAKEVLVPPPAYGLWRSSVRVDPDLLHWRRNEEPPPPLPGSPLLPSTTATTLSRNEGPRPPSYASEDGVSYVTEAAPQLNVTIGDSEGQGQGQGQGQRRESHSGVSDIHPAWRPGYAVSEVRLADWGIGGRL